MANISNEAETSFFEACEIGDIIKARKKLKGVTRSILKELRTSEGRTCLHVTVLAGDPGLLGELEAKLELKTKLELKELIKFGDRQGDTALHVGVKTYSMDMVNQLLKLEADLCDCRNNRQETPLIVAIRLQFLEAVELLIPRTKSSLEDQNKFLLHRVVSLNQVKLVRILIIFLQGNNSLSTVINLPYPPAPENCPRQPIVPGDTPLHIAARNKYERMVDLLVTVPGRKKQALNDEGKTAVEIAREVVEYYESFRIIRKLGDFKRKVKPFMYSAPQVSYEKHKRATDMISQTYKERRDAELVVAVLLATMTFTAFFNAPGGYQTGRDGTSDQLGTPVLISFTSFRVFLIFNCVAFYLSLFTCIMWELTSELTVGDKLFFMTINGGAVSLSFGLTAYCYLATMFTVLENNRTTFSWVVWGLLILLSVCGIFIVFYQVARFSVSRARLLRLCDGPRQIDGFVECVWKLFERCGFLDIFHFVGDRIRGTINGEFNPFGSGPQLRWNCCNKVQQSV